jgi:hypothetical protein
MRRLKDTLIVEPCAETADGVAPNPPPAALATTAHLNIAVSDASATTVRIARRRNRLRAAHRPAARCWARRAARRLLSLTPVTRRPTSL